MESFWLCGDCSQELTLRWDSSAGVVVEEKGSWSMAGN